MNKSLDILNTESHVRLLQKFEYRSRHQNLANGEKGEHETEKEQKYCVWLTKRDGFRVLLLLLLLLLLHAND